MSSDGRPPLPARVTASRDVVFQELAGEVVLLNLANERYYSLDDVGSRIWAVLAEHEDVESALAQLQAEYDVDDATLRQDVATLIGKLREAGLLTSDEDPPPGDAASR